jgi:predicted regulator of Ras-like GTPase activity (Roadblock/LC7/MglB family)
MLHRSLGRIAERLGDVHLLALVAEDGLVIERLCFDASIDVEALAAEMAEASRAILAARGELAVGDVRQLSMLVGGRLLIWSPLSPDTGLLLVADEGMSRGRARFELRRACLLFDRDLS